MDDDPELSTRFALGDEAAVRAVYQQSFDPERALRPWLATITRRTAVDIYRREARTRSEPHADVDDTVVPIAFERTWEAFEVRGLPADAGRAASKCRP